MKRFKRAIALPRPRNQVAASPVCGRAGSHRKSNKALRARDKRDAERQARAGRESGSFFAQA